MRAAHFCVTIAVTALMAGERPNFKKLDEPEENLELVERELYSPNENFSSITKSEARFHQHDIAVEKDWGGEGIPSRGRFTAYGQNAGFPFLKKFFIGAVIFFVISLTVSAYVFLGGGNVVSSNNVDIAITGPVSIAGGEILPIQIDVTNQNNADLDSADLIIDYPDGTVQADNMTESLRRYREALGTIVRGATVTRKVQAVLFGQEGDVKNINVSVEYRVKGSNAIFPKEKLYTVAISSAPVTVTINSAKAVTANQEAELSVDVVSNASTIIQNLALSAEYPFGFTFESADPAPSWSNSFWQLGDLKPGVKRTIKIRGAIAGQDNEIRVFKFSVGTVSATADNAIGTTFLTSTAKVNISKPAIGVSLAFDGDTTDSIVIGAGKSTRADLTLTNNSGMKITDVKASISIAGNIFNPESVAPSQGFYRSSDDTILWDQTLKPDLAVFNPDDTRTLSFSLNILSADQLRSVSSPDMTVTVRVTGSRSDASGLSQTVITTLTKDIRVPSVLGLSARALYYSGPFTNTGPIPPRVDSDTSYTIVWSLTNGSNDLSNVSVSATLPSYVKWLGVASPQSEKISFNQVGGQVVWNAGDLPAGTGFTNSPREVSFQVSLSPSLSQVRTSPVLITETTASGDDSFANQRVQANSHAELTTNLTTDIGFKSGDGTVVR